MNPDLTAAEWRYISILIANDVADDRERGIGNAAASHAAIWRKIQKVCEWEAMGSDE